MENRKNNRKKVFVTGGTGLLGHHLVKTAPAAYDIDCTFFPLNKKDCISYKCGKHHLDVSDNESVLATIRKIRPDYVVHTASIANVDYVEKHKEEAEETNIGGTMNVIRACQETGAGLIYISSNAVFDGRHPPYSEEDPVRPLSYYGSLKVKEEELVGHSGLKFSIVRAILMYGWNLEVERKNPVTWLLDELNSGRMINMVDDIFCNPLFVMDSVRAIWKIVESGKEGVFHVGGKDELSRYQFALTVADVFSLDKKLIRPVKNEFFAGIAPRPENTTYSTEKIKRELGIFPVGAREGLEAMKGARDAVTQGVGHNRRL